MPAKKHHTLTAPFILVCCLIAVPLLMRMWQLFPLYIDSYVRSSIPSQLQNLSARTGWILSDLSLERVMEDTVEVVYRPHFRETAPERCILVPLEGPLPTPLLPCDRPL